MRRIKLLMIIVLVVSVAVSQGCSYSFEEKEETSTLATIHIDSRDKRIDATESSDNSGDAAGESLLNITFTDDHFYGILSGYEDNVFIDGQILTLDYPETVCTYKIIRDINTMTETPNNHFQNVWINTQPILESGGIEQSDKDEYISSFSRIELQNMLIYDELMTMYPEKQFCDYVIRTTYPAESDSLYQVFSSELEDGNQPVNTIMDREFHHWFIRESIDRIPLGLPYDMMTSDQYDSNGLIVYIYSLYSQMFYDGMDIYEVSCSDNHFNVQLLVEEEGLQITPLEEVMHLIEPVLMDIVSDSHTGEGPKYIYAAELVYLGVQTQTDDGNNEETILYPFWAVYCDSGYTDVSGNCAYRRPILINALTEEVFY